jgi:TRAP-type C4-dicarboxylate transport system permease small subunit
MNSPTRGSAPRAGSPARRRASWADLLFKAVEGLLAAMLVLMLAMVLGNVILRYGFGTGITVSEELSRTMFVWITFIGAVVATREGTHLGVDSMVAHLPHGGKVACAVLSELIILGCCVLIFWGTWRQHEVNAASLVTGMPLIWIFGVGYVMSLGIGVLSVDKLWRIATGTIAEKELFDTPSTEAAAEALAKGEGQAL